MHQLTVAEEWWQGSEASGRGPWPVPLLNTWICVEPLAEPLLRKRSHSEALSLDPPPLCTWKGRAHSHSLKIRLPSSTQGAEGHLKILFKDKVTVWGMAKGGG